MTIRPIDQVSMMSKVQKVSSDKQAEKSKGEMLNQNTFANIQKELLNRQKKVNNAEKTNHKKISRDNEREKGEGRKKKEKDNEEKKDKGKNIDIRI